MKTTFMMLAALSAFTGLATASVTYNVSGAYTSGGTAQTLTATNGTDDFSLVWSITAGSANNTVATFPSNENFGEFTLTCTAVCDGASVTIPAFVFVITIDDLTDGGIGSFTGTSAGGPVSFNTTSGIGSSNVGVNWSPQQLGSGSFNATSGNFGNTFFTIQSSTPIVDPSTNNGVETISGTINSQVPEPTTLALLGAGLIGLGVIARKRKV
jgi:PEP-CTERM motif